MIESRSARTAFHAEEVAKEKIGFDKGDDRVVHERRLRRPAQRRARAERPRGPREGGEGVRDLPGLRRREGSSAPIRGSAASISGDVPARSARSARLVRSVFRQGPTSSAAGQRAITTFNRNWTNRMGLGGEASSPARASSRPTRCSATWRRRARAGLKWGSGSVRGLSLSAAHADGGDCPGLSGFSSAACSSRAAAVRAAVPRAVPDAGAPPQRGAVGPHHGALRRGRDCRRAADRRLPRRPDGTALHDAAALLGGGAG